MIYEHSTGSGWGHVCVMCGRRMKGRCKSPERAIRSLAVHEVTCPMRPAGDVK